MCGAEYEDLIHFMIKCKELEEERNTQLIMKKKGNDDEDTVGNLLFDIERTDLEITKKMLQRMWNKCNRIEKEWKKEREARENQKKKERRVWSLKRRKRNRKKIKERSGSIMCTSPFINTPLQVGVKQSCTPLVSRGTKLALTHQVSVITC